MNLINANTKLYCLIGNPIFNSLSPLIHNTFFGLVREQAIYLAFNIERENLKKSVDGLKSIGVIGYNVTMPFKELVVDFLDYISPEAEYIGAVNTVKNIDGKLIGYNTDGQGFIKSLEQNKIEINNKRVLILGAGGVAKAIALSLVPKKPKAVYIINRNTEKANALSNKIKSVEKNNIELETDINKIDKNNIDIIINATSVGMGSSEDSPIDLEQFPNIDLVYDTIYKPKKTRLLSQAESKNILAINGISMLINQAIISQTIWIGKHFDYEEAINKITKVINFHLNSQKI